MNSWYILVKKKEQAIGLDFCQGSRPHTWTRWECGIAHWMGQWENKLIHGFYITLKILMELNMTQLTVYIYNNI